MPIGTTQSDAIGRRVRHRTRQSLRRGTATRLGVPRDASNAGALSYSRTYTNGAPFQWYLTVFKGPDRSKLVNVINKLNVRFVETVLKSVL